MSELYVPQGGPPQGPPPSREILPRIGEEGVRALLRAHYRRLGSSEIAYLFTGDLVEAADRSADFFIQVLGGPPHYSQKYGPPRMRARHMPFPIDGKARDIWLLCFREALDEVKFPPEFRAEFEKFLEEFSAWMVNRA